MAIIFPKRQIEVWWESSRRWAQSPVVEETTKSTVCALLQEPLFFEFAGVCMDRKNYGSPPENSGIYIVTDGRPFLDNVPECANDSNNLAEWKYNFPWVVQLAKKLWRKLPSTEQMIHFLKAIPGDSATKMWIINAWIFPGYRDADDGIVHYCGYIAVWWTIWSRGYIECVLIGHDNPEPKMDWSYRLSGFSVRFLSEKK